MAARLGGVPPADVTNSSASGTKIATSLAGPSLPLSGTAPLAESVPTHREWCSARDPIEAVEGRGEERVGVVFCEPVATIPLHDLDEVAESPQDGWVVF